MDELQVAKGLGIFSIGLGLTQLAAPNWLGEKTGLGQKPVLMRACGARELAAGIGVLSQGKPAESLWARVAGDVIDIALLGWALAKNARKSRVLVSLGMVLGVTALDFIYARRLQGV